MGVEIIFIMRRVFTLFLITAIVLTGCATVNNSKTLPEAPGTTSNAESLIRETNDAGNEYYPRVSPDGKYLLYSLEEKGSSGDFGSFLSTGSTSSKKYKVVRKEIGSPVTNPLLNDASDANWYPDGKNIVFSYRKPSQPVIVKTNFEGIGLNYISQSAMGNDDANPSALNDGNTVLFTTLIGANRTICSMDNNGGKFTKITDGDRISINPVNGNIITYNLKVGNNSQIFLLDIKTGSKTQLTSGEYNNRDASFSKDGKWIVFSSNRENPSLNKYHIYIMKTDGTDLKQLTSGETTEGEPNWGPSGEIFFYSNAGGNFNIWKVKPRF